MGREAAKVCVTGGSGYIASWLIRKLLLRGYIVHTPSETWVALASPSSWSKVDLLRSLPNGDTNLVLFQADIINPADFEPAIQGCQSVFHVAHPMIFSADNTQVEDLINMVVACARSIADSCIRSGSVRRLIYTGSVVTMSLLNNEGAGYRTSVLNESSWTPPDVRVTNCNEFMLVYTKSKSLAQKELLKYNDMENSSLEVVSLDCAGVAGDTILPHAPLSLYTVLSPLLGDSQAFLGLKFLQELLGTVPLAHIDDICEAHVFCAEKQSSKGRFLCAATGIPIQEFVSYYQENYPELKIAEEFTRELSSSGVICDNSRLIQVGFEYKHDLKRTLDDTVRCGRRLGLLPS